MSYLDHINPAQRKVRLQERLLALSDTAYGHELNRIQCVATNDQEGIATNMLAIATLETAIAGLEALLPAVEADVTESQTEPEVPAE